jgi:hypothetical protein
VLFIKYNKNNKVKEDELCRTYSTIEEERNAYMLLVRKSERKRPLRRPRSTWVDNIKMDLGEMVWTVVDWIALAQDRDL